MAAIANLGFVHCHAHPWQDVHWCVNCLRCLYDTDGRLKTGKSIQPATNIAMGSGMVAHSNSTHHLRRHGREVGFPPLVQALASVSGGCYTVPHPVERVWYRCVVCSLDPQSAPRYRYVKMDEAGAREHMASPDHASRLHDGRHARFVAAGQAWAPP
jgi:hypothetical protein